MKSVGISSIFVSPCIGLLGLIFSIKEKSLVFLILNILLIFSFFIVMMIGHMVIALF